MGRKKEKKIREDDVGKQKGHEVGNPRNRFETDLFLLSRLISH
jgi:hypothetical protein